jgi:3'(2'), 5'-bisphosphate nucleotidase
MFYKSEILNKSQINQIAELVYEAGDIAKKYFFHKNFTQQKKPDGSCLTSVDLLLSDFLEKNLSKIVKNIPIICEENNLRNKQLDCFFLIDPIDGTSQFASGNCQFCINIALIKDSIPIFGLIYAPLFENKLVANQQVEAMLYNYNGELFLNNNLFAVAKKNNTKLKIVASPRASLFDINKFIEVFYPDFLQNYSVLPVASAVKFVQLLLGEENFYVHLRPSMAWDIASGHCLLQTAYGDCLFGLPNDDFKQNSKFMSLKYNSLHLKNSYFFADLLIESKKF